MKHERIVPPAHLLSIPLQFLRGTSRIQASEARFSPHGTVLAVLNAEDVVSVSATDNLSAWDVRTGKRVWQKKRFSVKRVKFSADGKVLACLTFTGPPTWYEVQLLDASTGQPLRRPTFKHPHVPGFALSPDGGVIALSSETGGRPNRVRLFDTASGKVLRTLDGLSCPMPSDVAFSPDGRYLAIRPDNDTPGYNLDCPDLIVYETATGRSVYRHEDTNYIYPQGMFQSIHVCHDPAFFTTNNRLVCSNFVLDLDRQPLNLRQMLYGKDDLPGVHSSRLFVGFVGDLRSGAGADQHLALFRTEDDDMTQLEFWDIRTKKEIRAIPEPKDYDSRILDYSPVTRLIARTSSNGILTLERP